MHDRDIRCLLNREFNKILKVQALPTEVLRRPSTHQVKKIDQVKKFNLLRKQLAPKQAAFRSAKTIVNPANGWLNAVRTSLGMSLEQVAHKLGVSKQNVQSLEMREKQKTISLKSLETVAHAMDMQLVYALIPKDDTLDALIERKAEALAYDLVQRTAQTMILEDQEVPYERLKDAVAERKQEIIQNNPKTLWD